MARRAIGSVVDPVKFSSSSLITAQPPPLSEITYTVSSGTLNSTIPLYHSRSNGIYLFADDAKLFRHVTCNEDYKALQLGLNALQDWSNKWLLRLNILKCKTVFFGRNINKNYT